MPPCPPLPMPMQPISGLTNWKPTKRHISMLDCIEGAIEDNTYCTPVADTRQFGGGGAIPICNEPNASQDHIV